MMTKNQVKRFVELSKASLLNPLDEVDRKELDHLEAVFTKWDNPVLQHPELAEAIDEWLVPGVTLSSDYIWRQLGKKNNYHTVAKVFRAMILKLVDEGKADYATTKFKFRIKDAS